MARAKLGKGPLRASLCAVWAILNLGLTCAFAVRGDLSGADLWLTARLVPACIVATFFGSRIHDRLDARQFRAGVLVVLLFAAAGLVFR
jgi:uncharacterized membrane protein YfcA